MSTTQIASEWEEWKDLYDRREFAASSSEPHVGIGPGWWNPRWIPITRRGFDNHCIDFAPSSEGRVGQIIAVYHDQPIRHVVGTNFRAAMERYVFELEGGAFAFSEEIGSLVRVEDL